MTTQFLHTPDAWMLHNQKPNQYINRIQKILLKIVNKDHESSYTVILTIRQQFWLSLTNSSEICTRTVESTEEYISRNFKMYLWGNRIVSLL